MAVGIADRDEVGGASGSGSAPRRAGVEMTGSSWRMERCSGIDDCCCASGVGVAVSPEGGTKMRRKRSMRGHGACSES